MRIINWLISKTAFSHMSDSDSYIKYLRKIGCRIGDHVTVYRPSRTYIDTTRPFLIEIGWG